MEGVDPQCHHSMQASITSLTKYEYNRKQQWAKRASLTNRSCRAISDVTLVRNIKNRLDRYIELQTQRWIYEKQTSITYESSS